MSVSRNYKLNNLSPKAPLLWPLNLIDTFDYLEISIKKFKPFFGRDIGSSGSSSATNSSTGLNTTIDLGIEGNDTLSVFSRVLSGSNFRPSANRLVSGDTILLPIPEEVSYKDNPQWSDQPVGAIGRFGPDIVKGFIDEGNAEGLTKSIQRFAKAGAVGKLLEIVKKNTGADPNAITQNINGKIANPYVEQVFGGIGLRQFDFSWKLVPRNKDEQNSINAIIKTLRMAVLPNKSDTFGLGGSEEGTRDDFSTERWLEVPQVFDLSWKSNGSTIQSLPKIKTCVCKDIQIQYTPDNVWATHLMGQNNPHPVAYNLTLSFGETEIITSDLVKEGF